MGDVSATKGAGEAVCNGRTARAAVCRPLASKVVRSSVGNANFVVPDGRLDTRQQEPSPEGASETCVFACCVACIIIIGQCSPPQWRAVASVGLQFAIATRDGPNSTSTSNAATNFVRCLTTSRSSYPTRLYRPVISVTCPSETVTPPGMRSGTESRGLRSASNNAPAA